MQTLLKKGLGCPRNLKSILACKLVPLCFHIPSWLYRSKTQSEEWRWRARNQLTRHGWGTTTQTRPSAETRPDLWGWLKSSARAWGLQSRQPFPNSFYGRWALAMFLGSGLHNRGDPNSAEFDQCFSQPGKRCASTIVARSCWAMEISILFLLKFRSSLRWTGFYSHDVNHDCFILSEAEPDRCVIHNRHFQTCPAISIRFYQVFKWVRTHID